MEEITSFVLDDKIINESPFYVEMSGITFPDPYYHISRNIGKNYILEYILEGSGTVCTNGVTFYPKQGDVYLLHEGQKQYYRASKDNPYKKIWMNVNGKICEPLLKIYGISDSYYFENCDIYPLFNKFYQTCQQHELSTFEIFDKCCLIFTEIIQKLSHKSNPQIINNSIAVETKKLCDKNVYQKISVKDIADEMRFSVSQINRIFKAEFNTTVHSYILESKIKTAKTLLTNTNMSIKEIAVLLCFNDEHYFSNIFKAKTGMRPSDLRMPSHLTDKSE